MQCNRALLRSEANRRPLSYKWARDLTFSRGVSAMTAKGFSLLAAVIFAIVAVLQFARVVSGWPVTLGQTISIPLWASWIACIVAAGLAWLGFNAARA
jgi:hypothetical protein